jgi:hypothetical protein
VLEDGGLVAELLGVEKVAEVAERGVGALEAASLLQTWGLRA